MTDAPDYETLKRQMDEEHALNDLLLLRATQTDGKVRLIEHVYSEAFPGYVFSPRFRVTVRRVCEPLPLMKLIEGMRLATSKVKDSHQSLNYFCGICWNWIKRPETRDW